MELDSLALFKDWSNALLVTTTAAIGWTAKKDPEFYPRELKPLCIILFSVSAMFAMATLALLPLIAEQAKEQSASSIYDVAVRSDLLKGFCVGYLHLRDVCFPQHFLFLAGIVAYAIGTTLHAPKPNAAKPPASGGALPWWRSCTNVLLPLLFWAVIIGGVVAAGLGAFNLLEDC